MSSSDLLTQSFARLLDKASALLRFLRFIGHGDGNLIVAYWLTEAGSPQRNHVGNRPLLFAMTVLILAGIQLLSLGLASEILSRTY
jgi:hypothetical protein